MKRVVLASAAMIGALAMIPATAEARGGFGGGGFHGGGFHGGGFGGGGFRGGFGGFRGGFGGGGFRNAGFGGYRGGFGGYRGGFGGYRGGYADEPRFRPREFDRPRYGSMRGATRGALAMDPRRMAMLFDEGSPLSKITTLRPKDYSEARTIGRVTSAGDAP